MLKYKNTNRIQWIDFAKGLTILLVIAGHSMPINIVAKAIYSFHMPLFFILSITTFRCSKNNDQFIANAEKGIKHLIIPALIIYCFRVICDIIINWNDVLLSFSAFKMFIQHEIVRLIFACGFYINVETACYEGIGVLWFLLALFVGRTLYDYIQLKIEDSHKKIMICLALSFMGFLLGKIQWLPWSLDVMLTIMPLFYFGEKLKNYNFDLCPVSKVVWNIVIWGVSFGVYAIIFKGRLDLNQRMYPCYPLCLVTAVTGTFIVSYATRLIEKWGGVLPINL